jgi:hypothetical protein
MLVTLFFHNLLSFLSCRCNSGTLRATYLHRGASQPRVAELHTALPWLQLRYGAAVSHCTVSHSTVIYFYLFCDFPLLHAILTPLSSPSQYSIVCLWCSQQDVLQIKRIYLTEIQDNIEISTQLNTLLLLALQMSLGLLNNFFHQTYFKSYRLAKR